MTFLRGRCKLQNCVSYFLTCFTSEIDSFQAEKVSKYDMKCDQNYDKQFCNLHYIIVLRVTRSHAFSDQYRESMTSCRDEVGSMNIPEFSFILG